MQAQIKRHLMWRFAGRKQPARKRVFVVRSNLKRNLMRADAGMGERIGDRVGRSQFAIPHTHCNSIGSQTASRSDVLATS